MPTMLDIPLVEFFIIIVGLYHNLVYSEFNNNNTNGGGGGGEGF